MLRTPSLALAFALALAFTAGCIAVPDDPGQVESAAVEPEDRIDGMTAEETITDATVDCDNGGLSLPPRVCAERVLVAEGRIGLDHLPIDLVGSNGEILISHSEGDAWMFKATIRVSALTEDMARRGLDEAWMWTHEMDGVHVILAGPNPTPSGAVESLFANVYSMQYELEIPSWMVIDLEALSDNGGIVVDEFEMGSVHVETDNGQIVLGGKARDVDAKTDNGEIVASLRPVGGGTWTFLTDNGQVLLSVPEGRSYGYDIEGKTDNGQVIIDLRDGDVSRTENGASFRTDRFDERAIRTTVRAETDNGQVIVSGL